MIALNVVKCFNTPKNIFRNRLSDIICINKIARPMSTVDPKEIEYLSSLKNIWWNDNCPLIHFNALRIPFVKDGLVKSGVKLYNSDLPLNGIKIADIGCGGGVLTEALAKIGAQVTGIDVSAELLNVAEDHVKLDHDISKRVNYVLTTVKDFAQKEKETYDAVVASEILEHVTDPELFLKECVRIVKPGKSIFITTINKTLSSWLNTIIAHEYIFKNIPCGTHQWDKFIAPDKVQRILEDCGCETKLICGFNFNPVTGRWSRSSSTSTFYGLHAVKQRKFGE